VGAAADDDYDDVKHTTAARAARQSLSITRYTVLQVHLVLKELPEQQEDEE